MNLFISKNKSFYWKKLKSIIKSCKNGAKITGKLKGACKVQLFTPNKTLSMSLNTRLNNWVQTFIRNIQIAGLIDEMLNVEIRE